ncbi:hypothetical protein D3C86_1555290 [compost metagenome]
MTTQRGVGLLRCRRMFQCSVQFRTQFCRQGIGLIGVLQTFKHRCGVEHVLAAAHVKRTNIVHGHPRRNTRSDNCTGTGTANKIKEIGKNQRWRIFSDTQIGFEFGQDLDAHQAANTTAVTGKDFFRFSRFDAADELLAHGECSNIWLTA